MLAAVTALVAAWVDPYLPDDLSIKIGATAIDAILGILASSMLAVTIFSLSTMVSAYAAATSSVTPRAAKLLIEDSFAQNALATFIGSFLFSLVGIIALNTDLYGDQGRVVLFVVTLGVIVAIVMTLLRWIDHASQLGRVGQTTARVEAATSAAMRTWHKHPYLGGRPLHDPRQDIPAAARMVVASGIGYVQHIDVDALQQLSRRHGGQVYVAALPGRFVHGARPLAWVLGMPGKDAEAAVEKAFTIDDSRSFDQDPRFGAAVLAEIASRALSPAMNDPGTAIDVIGRAVRILAIWAGSASGRGAPECPDVYVPGVQLDELFDDLFRPIARDGARLVEVGIRLQKALAALARLDDPRYAALARHHSELALERALAALAIEDDKTLVRSLAREVAGAR